MIENIRKYFNKNDTVLDFGCGTWTYSIAIADKVHSIHATDISEKMLAIATERANKRGIVNIRFEQLDLFDTSLQDESYNVVLAFNILHLQQDLNQTLQKIEDLLKPGGLLISKSVCAGETCPLILFLMNPFSKLGLLPHVSCFSFFELQNSISQNQMKILESRENHKGSNEYFIVAQKWNYKLISRWNITK